MLHFRPSWSDWLYVPPGHWSPHVFRLGFLRRVGHRRIGGFRRRTAPAPGEEEPDLARWWTRLGAPGRPPGTRRVAVPTVPRCSTV